MRRVLLTQINSERERGRERLLRNAIRRFPSRSIALVFSQLSAWRWKPRCWLTFLTFAPRSASYRGNRNAYSRRSEHGDIMISAASFPPFETLVLPARELGENLAAGARAPSNQPRETECLPLLTRSGDVGAIRDAQVEPRNQPRVRLAAHVCPARTLVAPRPP